MDDDRAILIGNEGGQHVIIRALSRSRPEQTDYWDGNWIESEVRVAAGAFRGAYHLSLRSEEFADFSRQVALLARSLSGTARFSTMEEQLELTLNGDGKGHVQVEGTAMDQAGIGNVLHFSFELDQTYLLKILRALEAVCSRFPVIGKPEA